MAQIDILKEILNYSLRKFNYEIIGSNIFYLFNNERYAKTELKKERNKNEFTGVTITYISKLYGRIDSCDIFFKDVFIDQKRASINVNVATDEYDWFEQKRPSKRDLYKLALHIERYIGIIGDFGNELTDYLSMSVLASQAALQDLSAPKKDSFLTARDIASILEASSLDDPPKEAPSEEVDQKPDEMPVILEIPEKEEPQPAYDIDIIIKDETTEKLMEDFEEQPVITETFHKELQTEENIDISTEEEPDKEVMEAEIKGTIEPVMEEPAEKAPKRRFLGFKIGSAKSQEKPVSSEIKIAEYLSSKPFISWPIGKVNPNDIMAFLYETDQNDFRLEIEGQGAMQNFKITPWSKYIDRISEIKISDGITSIGNNAFKSASLLRSVILPDSITEIGLSSFEFCSLLESVGFPNKLKSIGAFGFSGTENLKEVILPGSVERIDDYAFDITDELVIKCDCPEQLSLGAGLNASAFTLSRPDPRENISIKSYDL